MTTIMELDMINRDPNNLNAHHRALWEDVIGEPEAPRSINCVWRNSYKCYTCGLSCCYKFLTTICGLFIALYWGCCFACITCDSVWCLTPAVRSYYICCGTWKILCTSCTSCCLEPFCTNFALCFSRVHVYKK